MTQFTMDFRIQAFHPAATQAGQFIARKDESLITVGVMPLMGDHYAPLTGMAETVPTSQRDAAIARVTLAAVQSVLKQNEDKRAKP